MKQEPIIVLDFGGVLMSHDRPVGFKHTTPGIYVTKGKKIIVR